MGLISFKGNVQIITTFEADVEIFTPGLIFHLDAGDVASYPGSGDIWYDLSGNSYNATLVNGPTFSDSNLGNIVFDGIDDYVDTNQTSTNFGLDPSIPFTVEVWFRTSGANEYYLFDNFAGGPGISLRVNAGQYRARIAGSVSINIVECECGSNFNNNGWHQFAMTWDGFDTLKAYANGTNIDSNDGQIYGSFDSGYTIQIGSRPVVPSYFPGRIANVKVYNQELTNGQILQNFRALRKRFNV